ncbi:MAG: hypothetical protein JWQ18_25 [Conexibacter sp.]|nr:hypothetical protein [Conexibacter sp.]
MDRYALQARAWPALITGLPAVVVALAAAVSPSGLGVKLAGALLAVGGQVVTHMVRHRGRDLQVDLWRRWGGNPAGRRLSHVDVGDQDELDDVLRRVERVTGLTLPSAEEERVDPERAARRRDKAVEALRELTRSNPVVLAENIDYGFWRNLLGLKRTGRLITTSCLAGSIALLALGSGPFEHRLASWGLSLVVGVAMLGFWSRVVTESRVHEAAETYADQLLRAAHALPAASSAVPR